MEKRTPQKRVCVCVQNYDRANWRGIERATPSVREKEREREAQGGAAGASGPKKRGTAVVAASIDVPQSISFSNMNRKAGAIH